MVNRIHSIDVMMRALPPSGASFRVGQQARQCIRQNSWMTRSNENPGVAIGEYLATGGNVARYDRKLGRHGFDQGYAKAFIRGRAEDEDIKLGEQSGNIGTGTEKANRTNDAELRRLLLEVSAEHSLAYDPQLDRRNARGDVCECREQRAMVLDGIEPSHGTDSERFRLVLSSTWLGIPRKAVGYHPGSVR
jgi:hypothetical protein